MILPKLRKKHSDGNYRAFEAWRHRMFPTLSSTSFEKLYQAVDVCEGLMQEPDSPILGLHIEGPYLNPKMAGSQYEGFLKTPDEMNIFRYWSILLVSSVGISARNYVERMISPNIPVQRE